MRKQTNHGFYPTGIIEPTSGRTGRIIGRRALRKGLGNPKHRAKEMTDLITELQQKWFTKGVKMGADLQKARIEYSTAALTYGYGYTLEGVNYVEEPIVQTSNDSADSSVDPATLRDLGAILDNADVPTEGRIDASDERNDVAEDIRAEFAAQREINSFDATVQEERLPSEERQEGTVGEQQS